MQKENQYKKGKKKREKKKTILSIPVHKQENNNRKKLRETSQKKVAAFVTLCTICIGIEEEGGGLQSCFCFTFSPILLRKVLNPQQERESRHFYLSCPGNQTLYPSIVARFSFWHYLINSLHCSKVSFHSQLIFLSRMAWKYHLT